MLKLGRIFISYALVEIVYKILKKKKLAKTRVCYCRESIELEIFVTIILSSVTNWVCSTNKTFYFPILFQNVFSWIFS